MSVRIAVVAAVVLAVALAADPSSGGRRAVARADSQARAVVRAFFQTINTRQFGRTCDLLSVRFYREHHVPDRRHCVFGLRVGLGVNPTVRSRILGVCVARRRVVVTALANGVPGRIVLVEDSGTLKILSVAATHRGDCTGTSG
jgi:hypothetical protein